jgi:hypothetical protein
MTRVTIHDFVRKVALYVPAEQESNHVITVRKEKKVLSVEEKK